MNEIIIENNTSLTASQNLSEILIDAFLYDWKADRNITEKSVDGYHKALKRFFLFVEECGITNPNVDTIRLYKSTLTATLKPATVNLYLTVVHQFFKWTEEKGFYPNIYPSTMKGEKVSRAHKKDYLTSEQVNHLLETMPRQTINDVRNYAIVRLLVTCGMRTIELQRADIGDVRTVGNETVIYIQGKGHTEKDTPVVIPSATSKAIREYLSMRDDVEDDAPLFANHASNYKGQRLLNDSISRITKKALKDAGMNKSTLTAHSLRHTAGTLSVLNGESVQDVQQFMRHANINTTMIYLHEMDAINNTCSRTVDNLITS